MKFLAIVTLLFACACGAQPEGLVQVQMYEGNSAGLPVKVLEQVYVPADETSSIETQDSDLDGDYGQARQALISVPYDFGNPIDTSSPGSVLDNACFFPNTNMTPCMVPTDKIIKYSWSGAKTSTCFPGIDFAERLSVAISDMHFVIPSWTITPGSSSTNEKMMFGASGSLGVTSQLFGLPATIHQVGPVGDEWYVKSNKCTTKLDTAIMCSYWGAFSTAVQKSKILRLIKHEMGHCMGLSDFTSPTSLNNEPRLMYKFDATSPGDMNQMERAALGSFHL